MSKTAEEYSTTLSIVAIHLSEALWDNGEPRDQVTVARAQLLVEELQVDDDGHTYIEFAPTQMTRLETRQVTPTYTFGWNGKFHADDPMGARWDMEERSNLAGLAGLRDNPEIAGADILVFWDHHAFLEGMGQLSGKPFTWPDMHRAVDIRDAVAMQRGFPATDPQVGLSRLLREMERHDQARTARPLGSPAVAQDLLDLYSHLLIDGHAHSARSLLGSPLRDKPTHQQVLDYARGLLRQYPDPTYPPEAKQPLLSGSWTAKVYDAAAARELRVLQHPGPAFSAATLSEMRFPYALVVFDLIPCANLGHPHAWVLVDTFGSAVVRVFDWPAADNCAPVLTASGVN